VGAAVGRVPAGHRRQLTILGGLSLDGLVACMWIEAGTDRDVFTAFVQHVIVSALRPAQAVLLDNLSAHKVATARTLIEAAGCTLLCLPLYSPNFNPIEQAWRTLKSLRRRAAARMKEALDDALSAVIERLTATDAQSWFADCGYVAPN
jgi:transposase